MNFSIVTEYSLWLSLLCAVLAGLYTWILYRQSHNFDVDALAWKLKVMSGLRFITVFFISFLLLAPMIKTLSKTIEKPILILAQDNSESITINKDSAFYKKQYPEKIKQWIAQLSDKFEVKTYSFGEKVSQNADFSFSDKHTDFSAWVSDLKSKYTHRNVGAIVVASDGIYNKGVNPMYLTRSLPYQIHSIALGDTSRQKDIRITNVKTNKIAFLGNLFPIQAKVEIDELQGLSTEFKVIHKGKEVFKKVVTAKNKKYSETIDLELKAEEKGIQQYTLETTVHTDEINTSNNRYTIVIEVIDSKQKILLLASAPHPDLGAIRKTLEQNPNYAVELFTLDKFSKTQELSKYNLVILHQIPSVNNAASSVLSALSKTDVPTLFILGAKSDFNKLNSLKTVLSISQKKQVLEENCRPAVNKQFTLFELSPEIQTFTENAPPLIVPFGDYKLAASANVLFYQKIKNIQTTNPLILFDNQGDRKTAFIVGEGIWRWRLADYMENNSHTSFDELINKMVQYLSLKVSKDPFTVNIKKVFAENEPIAAQAEVYNDSYELITTAEVKLEIYNSQNKKFEFLLDEDKATKTYSINAGVFPVGEYTYKAHMKNGSKVVVREGKFLVIPVNEEAQNTIANHQLMNVLASQNGGKLFYPKELDKLAELLNNNKDILPTAYIEKNLKDLIHLKTLFFLILLLLGAEWFMRKYYGGY